MSEKANVLVMGNSGAGKSTLINSVFNFDSAEVGIGKAVTNKMAIYENEDINFRAIDTKGLEYGYFRQRQAKNEIKKWSKDSVKNGNAEEYIHIIWYCVDATSKRLFDKNLDTIKNVSKMWKNVPILIVLTKSYSEIETEENIEMVRKGLDIYKKKNLLNVVDIIPLVAQQFPINKDTIIPSIGVDQLIEKTNEIIPESFKINSEAVAEFSLQLIRNNANALVVGATSGAGIVGAIPIPISDSLLLTPLQVGMVRRIIYIYHIDHGIESTNGIVETLVGGTVIANGAKLIISGLKAVPGINIAAAVINAVVAAIITAALGEITIEIMERIAKGEIDPEDLDIIKKITENEFMKKVGFYFEKYMNNNGIKNINDIGKLVSDIFVDSRNKKTRPKGKKLMS